MQAANKKLFMKQLIYLILAVLFLQSCEHKNEVHTGILQQKKKQILQNEDKVIVSKIEKDTLQTRSKKSTSKIIPPKPKVYIEPDPDPYPGGYGFREPLPDPIPGPLPEPPDPQEPEILSFAEKMPEFKGGNEKLMEFLKKNIRYPEMCKEMGIEGNVYVRMIIDQTGKVTQPTVVKAVDNTCGLEKEAIRIIKLLPDFIPAENGGKKVSVYYHLPVRFRLE